MVPMLWVIQLWVPYTWDLLYEKTWIRRLIIQLNCLVTALIVRAVERRDRETDGLALIVWAEWCLEVRVNIGLLPVSSAVKTITKHSDDSASWHRCWGACPTWVLVAQEGSRPGLTGCGLQQRAGPLCCVCSAWLFALLLLALHSVAVLRVLYLLQM